MVQASNAKTPVSDTRTPSPCVYLNTPFNLKLRFDLSELKLGNGPRINGGGNVQFQQNFGDLAYIVEASAQYLNVDGKTVNGRYTFVGRVDKPLLRFSDDFTLSLAGITTAAYDKVLGLEPRVTAGGGPWLDYVTELLCNGFSIFPIMEHERGGGAPDKLTLRLSARNYLHIPLGEGADFTLDSFFAPSATDFEDYRASVIPGLAFKISALASVNFGLVAEYNSKPRNPELKPFDLTGMASLILDLGPDEPAAKEEDKGVNGG